MDKIAKELLNLSKEIVAGSRVASDVSFKWSKTYRTGGTYTAVIYFGDDNADQVADAMKGALKTMHKRMEKAGLEPDTPEVVEVGDDNIYIVQDEVFTIENAKGDKSSAVSDKQVMILLKG